MVVVNKRNTVNKKYYIISGAIILTLLVFVFLYESNGNYYKKSVEDTYALLVNSDINISVGELKAAGPEILKINVVFEGEESEMDNYISVQAENLLDKDFVKRLKNHKETIVIVSEDIGLAAHTWLILNRKGIDNMKILGISENEMFKYTFESEMD